MRNQTIKSHIIDFKPVYRNSFSKEYPLLRWYSSKTVHTQKKFLAIPNFMLSHVMT